MTVSYRTKDYTQWHIREQVYDRINNKGHSYEKVRTELGIWSHSTISRWSTHVEIVDWLPSLKSIPSAPREIKRKYDFKTLYLIYTLKKYKELPLDDLKEALESDHQITIPRSSLSYHLNNMNLTYHCKSKEEKEEMKNQRRKLKEYTPWYVHIDISYWPTIDWKKCYIYVCIERTTRLMYLEIHDNKKASTAASFLRNAQEFLPFHMHTILTDNGKEFSLKNHKWKYDLQWAFDVVCDEFNIRHRTTRPYTPKTNGMVEKVNDTIKTNTVLEHTYDSRSDMVKDLLLFMVYYNLERRHWSLRREIPTEHKRKTPYDALIYYYKLYPEKFKDPPHIFRKRLVKLQKKHTIYSKHDSFKKS